MFWTLPIVFLVLSASLSFAGPQEDLRKCQNLQLNEQSLCLGRAILGKVGDAAGLVNLEKCSQFYRESERLQCVGTQIFLSVGGSLPAPPPVASASVSCQNQNGKFRLIRNLDNQALGNGDQYKNFYQTEIECRQAELTATEKYACVPDHYFGYQVYIYDVWKNEGLAQFGENCFEALEKIKRGRSLLCVYGDAWNRLTVYSLETRKKLFPSHHTLPPESCLKAIDNSHRGNFCFSDNSHWSQFDSNGSRREDKKDFPTLDDCIKDLRPGGRGR